MIVFEREKRKKKRKREAIGGTEGYPPKYS
jgi:hypothetical protein